MSRFYGEVQGTRGIASRQGSEKSGMWAHIRGWDVGIKVFCIVDERGYDVLRVYKTGGSNNSTIQEHIGDFIS